MTQRQRVDGQPAFMLHAYPYSETSLIVDVFSRDFGRLALLARGARRPRSALRGVLLAFQPLELGWAGRGEVQTLMRAEWQGGQPLLAGPALFFGYYLNELLMRFLPREDAHSRLFSIYAETLHRLAAGAHAADLRCFECSLLDELGYGLLLEKDSEGKAVIPEAQYVYEIERGPIPIPDPGNTPEVLNGRTLLDLARRDLSDYRSLSEAKHLMRKVIAYHMGGRMLASRRIFKELREL